MNRAQAVDLANVIGHIRPDWQQPGTIAALTRLEATYPAAALHAIRTAADPASKTPAAINATPVTTVTSQPNTLPRDDDATIQARRQAVADCNACDNHGYRGPHLCDHDPDRATRNAAARAAARAAVRPTRTGSETP